MTAVRQPVFQCFIHYDTGQHKTPYDNNLLLLTPRFCQSKRDQSQEY